MSKDRQILVNIFNFCTPNVFVLCKYYFQAKKNLYEIKNLINEHQIQKRQSCKGFLVVIFESAADLMVTSNQLSVGRAKQNDLVSELVKDYF